MTTKRKFDGLGRNTSKVETVWVSVFQVISPYDGPHLLNIRISLPGNLHQDMCVGGQSEFAQNLPSLCSLLRSTQFWDQIKRCAPIKIGQNLVVNNRPKSLLKVVMLYQTYLLLLRAVTLRHISVGFVQHCLPLAWR